MTLRSQQVPGDAAARLTLAQSMCRFLARRTGRNFYYAFRVLPRDKHADMCTLYAFMRKTDDLADSDAPASRRRQLLDQWRADLDAALAGEPAANLFLLATAEMVARRGIEAAHLHAVIDGCLQDTRPVAVDTPQALHAYCYHVAGAVGLCCVRVWGFDDRQAEAVRELSIETGYAFQLTNILRDLKEDAAAGRVYLPSSTLGGFTAADLRDQSGPPTGRLREVLDVQLKTAKDAYERSAALLPLLSRDGRRVLSAMRAIYGGLLNEIERRELDVFTRRVRLPAWRKLMAAARASRLR